MGIRFLPVAELVQEFFLRPAESQPAAHFPPAQSATGAHQPRAPPPWPAAPPPPAAPPWPLPAPAAADEPRQLHPVFALRFADLDSLRKIYQRDISQGGLFVSTPQPALLHEIVIIELHLPSGPPFSLMARVVQRFEPRADGVPNLLCGMGVELFDLASARGALQAVLG